LFADLLTLAIMSRCETCGEAMVRELQRLQDPPLRITAVENEKKKKTYEKKTVSDKTKNKIVSCLAEHRQIYRTTG